MNWLGLPRKPTLTESGVYMILQQLKSTHALHERMERKMATNQEIQERLLREVAETGDSTVALLTDIRDLLTVHAQQNPGIDTTQLDEAATRLNDLQEQQAAASASIRAALATPAPPAEPPAAEPAPETPPQEGGA